MLKLIIKAQFADLILRREKKEEYRVIKPYYISRLAKAYGYFNNDDFMHELNACKENKKCMPAIDVMFIVGYRSDAFRFTARARLTKGCGVVKWGAEEGRVYFVLKIDSLDYSPKAYEAYIKNRILI